jgi:DtxR family Mn-dependent transcriptional regulator
VHSATVENYLKQIYQQTRHAPAELLPPGKLAGVMAVAPGTATAMIKTLADDGLVDYEPRSGIRLTPAGQRAALDVLRRHRLIELFLVKVLKLDWSEVHAEAEELEHAISPKVLDRIDQLLGHPQTDPHGDPIPSPAGKVRDRSRQTLANFPLNRPATIARVTDQNAQFLKLLTSLGLTPTSPITIISRDEVLDRVTVRTPPSSTDFTLGMSAAAKIEVE